MRNLKEYNLKKDRFLGKTEELKEILINNNIDILDLHEIQKRLIENTFSIIVVGEFSSGKSTFINALLKKDILPSKVLPTTAIVTIIEDGDDKATVKYKDGKEREISIEEIKSFATALDEKGAKEATQIDHMIVKTKNSYTKEGVSIIDTPGVEDLDKSREEITYNMIPKSDAAILVLDCRRSLKNSEIKFLQEKILLTNINKIFYILNFADSINIPIKVENEETDERKFKKVLDTKELNNIINVTTEKLRDITKQENLKIFALSSKKSLKASLSSKENEYSTMFNPFERELEEFLVNEKGRILLKNSMSRIEKVFDQINNILAFKLQAINKPIQELKIKEKELYELNKKIKYETGIITGQLRNSFNGVYKTIEPNIKSIVISAIKDIEIDTSISNELPMERYKEIINSKINSSLDNYFERTIRKEIENIIFDTEGRISNVLKNIDEFMKFEIKDMDNLKNLINMNINANNIEISTEDLIKTGAIVGLVPSLSTLLLASVFSLSFGAAIVVGGIITAFLTAFGLDKYFSYKRKEKFIEAFRNNLNTVIKNISLSIESLLIKSVDEYSLVIDRIVSNKLNATEKALNEILIQKEKEVKVQDDRIKEISKINIKINKIEKELRRILEE